MEITTSTLNGHGTLPWVVRPVSSTTPTTDELIGLIDARRDWMDGELSKHGGILFRGFAVPDAESFNRVAQALIPELKPYIEGQSPRTKVNGNVYTSTEHPPQFHITLHNELSYAKHPPRRIIFHCHTPPASGGETPILDCRKAYQLMDADVRRRFEEKGVRYLKNMHGQARGLGKSWMEHFETEDRSVVEVYLRENDLEFQWMDDGTLRTAAIRPGVIRHPDTGEMVWANQANLWHISNFEERRREQLMRHCGEDNLPTHARFGDDARIDDEELDRVRKVLWDNSVIFPWQQGDVLLLDNLMVAHGRMPYEGPRKILVAMG